MSDPATGDMAMKLGESERNAAAPGRTTTTTIAQPKHRHSGRSIRRVEARDGIDGAQIFVIVFDGPVPDDRISFVDDIKEADLPHVAYTTQEWAPDDPTPIWTCGAQHFGFHPPAVVGSVDVLLPDEWFQSPPDTDSTRWSLRATGFDGKAQLCGSHFGAVQLAIWAPSSHDPDDVRVHFAAPTRLVVEIQPRPG